MRRNIILVAAASAALLIVAMTPPAGANLCAFDAVPAATLLFPYVVYDYNNPDNGIDTVITITNVAPQAQIVHVQVWSDIGEPVVGFNVVLSGYDVQRIDLRTVLRDGQLPLTGTVDNQVGWGEYPHADGSVSHNDGYWLTDILPASEPTQTLVQRCSPADAGYPGNLSAGELATIRSTLQMSQYAIKMHDDCAGNTYTLEPVPDWWELRNEQQPTWMYLTADVVWDCGNLTPDSPDYWKPVAEGGRARHQNVLIGHVRWTKGDRAAMDQAVHIEASEQLAGMSTVFDITAASFYHRYSSLNGVQSDQREPLPTAWALPYTGVATSDHDSYLRVWKGPMQLPGMADLRTDGTYLAYDCLAYTYFAWDEDENVTNDEMTWFIPPDIITVQPNLLPLATQEIPVNELETPGSDGWLLFVWPGSNWEGVHGAPSLLPAQGVFDYYQTWMGVAYGTMGELNGAMTGTVMANFNCFADQVLPGLGVDAPVGGGADSLIFADGFITGDSRRWTFTTRQ